MAANAEKIVQFKSRIGADNTLRKLGANEIVFAVVGPVGSGTSSVVNALSGILSNDTYKMDVNIIKASDAIVAWSNEQQANQFLEVNGFNKVTKLQDAGDKMREADPAAVGIEILSLIKNKRELLDRSTDVVTSIKEVATKRRAYIIDSLKHPAEVELLRAVYQDAFCLIGVVCVEEERERRLREHKCRDAGVDAIKDLMHRDENADIPNGQKVTDTFHLADFFVDNSPKRFSDAERTISNPLWDVTEKLGRLVDLITVAKVVRPTPSEVGMFHAYGAKMRSACLSRQVGAALLDRKGNVISTGTNEVPRAGGGVYGGSFDAYEESSNVLDDRCAITKKICSSNKVQVEIIKEIIDAVPELKAIVDQNKLIYQLKKTPIGKLLEFSRAVHAEMDALMSAARIGATTIGTRLFVTTYPCHYCARHIVAAGVDEVQYIEPYPKSRALNLHGDAITGSPENWRAPTIGDLELKSGEITRAKVLFRPFTGVAPRLYRKVFLKDRKLKNAAGEHEIFDSDVASGLLHLSYKDVEDAILLDRQGE